MSKKKITQNLTFWVLISIFLGVLLGHFAPDWALYSLMEKKFTYSFLGADISMGPSVSELLSGFFISLVKLFIHPIIFLTISLGIVNMGNLKKVGRVGGKALLYFEVITTVALVIGLLVSTILVPGEGVIRSDVAGGDISKYTSKAASFSWLLFLKENFTVQVLFFSIFFGVFLNSVRGKARMISGMEQASHWVFKALHWVMYLAPLGAMGGMAYTIGKFGIHSLLPLAKLMASVYITMGLFIFVILALVMRSCGERITSFLSYIKAELLIVLGTSSSEAALPSLMQKLEKMGCSKSVVGLVVPAGYSFNLDGTSIYLSMATLFLAQVYGIQLNWEQLLTIIGVLMVTSKGAAGVTGSGFVVLASTLTALQVIPLEGLALLLGVDRFMSEARAITNFIGNGVATIWLAKHEGEFHAPESE
ncbi:cation:dicarboxylate symporter family transporter [Aquirufa aurantiipilula]|uniref:Cation:dicarboxylase symporter family transporter n=1 Tax=Aquirufa aurantiipilula TaxID=2696561 RepID=A0ABT6BHU5_9BACT|nr:cation:dicarboxylase symporter family transporter [Aquirufa aurantiipilula]MDF5690032.1 cation:dicarboxylase symporter family transporter [Aquirufa aurantiipilula]